MLRVNNMSTTPIKGVVISACLARTYASPAPVLLTTILLMSFMTRLAGVLSLAAYHHVRLVTGERSMAG